VTWDDFLPGEKFFFPRAKPKGKKNSLWKKNDPRHLKKLDKK
jgi:hypothetical protein